MSRSFLIGVLVVLCLVQVSCALSPQQITIKPDINVSVMSYGAGQAVNIHVEDQRASTVIGTRGGVYGDTSTIEIGNDFKNEIAHTLLNSLSRWSFKPQVDGGDKNATQFNLALVRLSYTPDSNQAIGKVHITSSISVDVKLDGRTYHGIYEASGEMGYVTVPSEAKNNAQINQVLNLSLQKIFEDQALINFLQR